MMCPSVGLMLCTFWVLHDGGQVVPRGEEPHETSGGGQSGSTFVLRG